MTLLIATRNAGKLREVNAILGSLQLCLSEFDLVTLDRFPELADAIEDADTFEGNARKKALHYAGLTNLWTLADDSGLEVDALSGAPGVYSARYAGVQGDDAANNAKLITALRNVPEERRKARFRCVVALAQPGEVLAVAEGCIGGRIVDVGRGENGFGYDPHFFVPEHRMTAAQMPSELKNSISHRAKALEAMRPKLLEFLSRVGQ